MAKFLFKDYRYDGYYFDDTDNCVYSTKRPGAPAKLTWQKRNSWSLAFVTLSYKSGYYQCKDTKTLDQVRAALKATPEGVTQGCQVVPNGDYIAFSVKNKCSQYFHSGTSVQAALEIFEKRGHKIEPEELRIMNPVTGVIRSLTVQTVKVYTLV